MKFRYLIALSATILRLHAIEEASPAKIRLIYNTLDPQSVAQHLALYELYPDSPVGKQALSDALRLLSGSTFDNMLQQLTSLKDAVQGIINLINKQPGEICPDITEEALTNIEKLAANLPHKKLLGHSVWSEEEVLRLPSEEIDLARGLFLSEALESENTQKTIRSYEAMLDLMALQILARLPDYPTALDKIRTINDFIFFEMGFRFPPHSKSVKDIDIYSFLPTVIDSRKGVCLGVSILYLCLAQRLDLDLEIITPPGHIFVRYENGKKSINIETTARGIHLEDETYLSIDTRNLQRRTIKQAIGMAHFNQAAFFWQKNDHEKALKSYLKAIPYIPDDLTIKELMGYNYLLVGDLEKGRELMEEVKDYLPDFAVSKQTVAQDFLNGNVDVEGIRAIFMFVDEDRKSLLLKKDALEKTLQAFPNFRAGLFSLAGTWLQLHRLGEALEVLEKYHELDDSDPSIEYYLAELYAQRMDYNKSWDHFKRAEQLTLQRNHKPKALKHFQQKLSSIAPE